MQRTYVVTFYTQKDKVLRWWEYYTTARSLKNAKDIAQEEWYSSNESHMFHCNSQIIGSVPDGREANTFIVTRSAPVTWGHIKR